MVIILVFLQSQIFAFLPLSSHSCPPLTQKFVWPLLEPDQGADPADKGPEGKKKQPKKQKRGGMFKLGMTPNPKCLEEFHPDKELSEFTCRNMELFGLGRVLKPNTAINPRPPVPLSTSATSIGFFRDGAPPLPGWTILSTKKSFAISNLTMG